MFNYSLQLSIDEILISFQYVRHESVVDAIEALESSFLIYRKNGHFFPV